jgi:hypothetical protein
MTTATRTRTSRPAVCESEVLTEPCAPCELAANGLPGAIRINGIEYRVEIIGELPPVGQPIINGYRLTREGSESRDVCMEYGGLVCDCPDFLYRRANIDRAGCRHCQAVRKHFVQPREQMPLAVNAGWDNP